MLEALTYDDVTLVPKFNPFASRKDVSLYSKVDNDLNPNLSLELHLPVLSANMDTITGSEMANAMHRQHGSGVLHRFCSIEQNVQMYQECLAHPTFVSVGCGPESIDRARALYEAGARYFCLDIAHAHSVSVKEIMNPLREVIKDSFLMAGNVATYDGAMFLKDLGVQLVKVGVGGGSVCTTRITTGFGIPMITSIQSCSKANVPLVADGGIRYPGDAVKALAAGASFVMIGGMLAGTEPTPGKVVDGYKTYRGMASKEAHESFLGPLPEWRPAEGISTKVRVKFFKETMHQLESGIRSGLTYAGVSNILDLHKNAEFMKITAAGKVEATPHHGG